jgi:hypothetical protein
MKEEESLTELTRLTKFRKDIPNDSNAYRNHWQFESYFF